MKNKFLKTFNFLLLLAGIILNPIMALKTISLYPSYFSIAVVWYLIISTQIFTLSFYISNKINKDKYNIEKHKSYKFLPIMLLILTILANLIMSNYCHHISLLLLQTLYFVIVFVFFIYTILQHK